MNILRDWWFLVLLYGFISSMTVLELRGMIMPLRSQQTRSSSTVLALSGLIALVVGGLVLWAEAGQGSLRWMFGVYGLLSGVLLITSAIRQWTWGRRNRV